MPMTVNPENQEHFKRTMVRSMGVISTCEHSPEGINKLIKQLNNLNVSISCNREHRSYIENLLNEIDKTLTEIMSDYNKIQCTTIKDYDIYFRSAFDESTDMHVKQENGKLMKLHTCPHCNTEFQSNRLDAKYCSVKCKQAAYRNRHK